MKFYVGNFVAAGFLAFAATAAQSAVVLEDGSVRAGLSDFGTLGSNYDNSPGILFDKTGSGNYGVNDFLTPGIPFEGFYISYDGGFQHSSNDSATSFLVAAPVLLSATKGYWTSSSQDGTLSVTNAYSLTTVAGRSQISISTTLTNNTGDAMSGLKFLRTLDPDPDEIVFGSTKTVNSVISSNQVCATGTGSGQTVCIWSDSSFTHKAGVSPYWSTFPSDYLNGTYAGFGDYTIGIGFDLGSLAAGQSVKVDYAYALGDSKSEVVTSVPEPETYAMMLAGLGVMGVAFHRKNNANV